VNAAIEIHDSELAAVAPTENGVIVRLAPAYVHRSRARPGFDAGSVWSQPVELLFTSGVVPLPCVLETAVRFEARNLHA
jgi:hypothetical protein